MSASIQRPLRRAPGRRLRGEVIAAWCMLALFAVWTAAFVWVSALVAGSGPAGEVPYIRAWLPWLAVTLAWVLPLLAGVILGVHAARRGGGLAAWAAAAVNAAVLVLLTLPSLIDRLVNR